MTPFGLFTLTVILAALAPLTHAQPVYRSITPDGRIVFSDTPPPGVRAEAPRVGAAAPDSPSLPYALRQATERFPVTLYSAANCVPCDAGRALLLERGIPFSERTVESNDDVQALQRLSGDASLPLLTIGRQHLKGFSSPEWSRYLDAAAYPKTSALPANWRPAAAKPLAPRAPIDAPTLRQEALPQAQSHPNPPAPPVRAPQPDPRINNPAGIQF